VLHRRLGLGEEEEARLAPLESRYLSERKILEGRARDANIALMAAIRKEEDAAAIEAASAEIKDALAAIQDLSIGHLITMRRALAPEHRAGFDQAVEASFASEEP
jgi:Spy/CpxP family protein refolding chaperone